MNRTEQFKAWRFDDGSFIVAPRFGFTYDIPWMAPHASGRLLDSAILQYQTGVSVDAAHKVTQSRNKREGKGYKRQRSIFKYKIVNVTPKSTTLQYQGNVKTVTLEVHLK